jgi:hypothetical protein
MQQNVEQHSKAGYGRKAALRPKCRKNMRHFCLAKPLFAIINQPKIRRAALKSKKMLGKMEWMESKF